MILKYIFIQFMVCELHLDNYVFKFLLRYNLHTIKLKIYSF